MKFLAIAALILVLTTVGKSQHWQSTVTLESRLGYSTNSYLTPYLAEWNRTVDSGYSFNSVMGQTFWSRGDHAASMMLGGTYQPFFQSTLNNWSGMLGLGEYSYRLTGILRAGVEAGGSSFSGSYNRSLAWIQPKITWHISPFTLFRFKVGSFYQDYAYPSQENQSSWINFYNAELELWPSYRWRISAGVNGDVRHLPDIREGVGVQTKLSYLIRNGTTVSLSSGVQQYQTEQIAGGEVPTDGLLETTQTAVDTDRMYRVGMDVTVPVNSRLVAFAGIDQLHYRSRMADLESNDYHVSGGVRFHFEPRLGKSNRRYQPEWEVNRDRQRITVKYSGDGRLFLVGDFNDWSKNALPLTHKAGNEYVTELSLPPGAYEYKILKVQGNTEEWLQFSADTYTVDDGFGSENAMLLVE